MKILLVSDTHGREDRLKEAVHAEWPFDYMVHCGDVQGAERMIQNMVSCACLIVAGNNDIFTDLPREMVLPLEGHRILVTHGHRQGVHSGVAGLKRLAVINSCDTVFFGHTHRPAITLEDGITFLNPGSLTYPRQEGRQPSYMLVNLGPGQRPEATIRYL